MKHILLFFLIHGPLLLHAQSDEIKKKLVAYQVSGELLTINLKDADAEHYFDLSSSVKDSLFKGDDRYKSMMNVPYAQGGETFEMKAEIVDKGGYKAPVFEAKVKKDIILYDQPRDLMARENAQISVEEVNGPEIRVGSLTDVSTNGNWPPIYDKKGDQ